MANTLQHDGLAVGTGKPQKRPDTRGERRFHRQTSLLYESVRRETFTSWPLNFLLPDELAAAGFFYLRTQDHVQCAFCQGIVGFWDPNDEPMTEHKKHFPNCPFIAGVATGNVPLARDEGEAGRLYALLDDYYRFRVANTKPQVTTTYQIDSLRLPDSPKLAFPALNTTQSRLRTFSHWPKDVGLSFETLAEAGFFSTGLSDWVQCFHCGGGLHSWLPEDDPWDDHARFFPFCPFVRMQRGEEAVSRTWKERPVPQVATRPLEFKPEEAQLLLHHPVAKRAIQMGLSADSMKGALRQRLENFGVMCRTVTEAMELVFDYEEEQRKKSAVANNCHDGIVIAEMNRDNQPVESMMIESHQSAFFPKETPPAAFPDHNPEYIQLLLEVQQLRQDVAAEERRILCRNCGQKKVAVVFQPCSHLHLCADCARPRDTCFTCGTIVRGTLRPIIS